MDCDPQRLLNVTWPNEAYFSLSMRKTSGRRQPFVSTWPSHCLLFMWLFGMVSRRLSFWILSFLKSLDLNLGRKPVQLLQNLMQNLMLLRDYDVPALQERHALPVVTFMQHGTSPHFARKVKAFLLDTFTEDRVIIRCHKFEWSPRSPDLFPIDFCCGDI